MRYYQIDTLGDGDPDWIFLETPPEDMELAFYMPAEGERVGAEYPDDASVYMHEDQPGIRKGSLIGNTQSYLIVAEPVKKVIEEYCAGVDIEYLPFTLYDHRKRVHSRDYWIVNPIGALDCLNLSASDVEYLDAPGDPYHGEVVGVDLAVLDPKKLEDAPALFRVREEPYRYIIRSDLAEALTAAGFTNLVLEEMPQEEGDE